MSLSDADLAAMKERETAATPGPWKWTHGMDSRARVLAPDETFDVRVDGHVDADFIAHARTDVPALLAEVEELRAENERLQRRLYPSQGEGYANEVERQRYVIEELQRIAAEARVDRDRLRKGIWDAVGVLGFGRDGDPTPDAYMSDMASLIVEMAREVRRDCDEAERELDAAEADRDRLRALLDPDNETAIEVGALQMVEVDRNIGLLSHQPLDFKAACVLLRSALAALKLCDAANGEGDHD